MEDQVTLAFKSGMINAFNYRGHMSRKVFWLFITVILIIRFSLGALAGYIPKTSAAVSVVDIALLVPMITATMRRLRNASYSAWWTLLIVSPLPIFAILDFAVMHFPKFGMAVGGAVMTNPALMYLALLPILIPYGALVYLLTRVGVATSTAVSENPQN